MNRKSFYLFLSAVILVVGFWAFTSYRNDTDRLLARFNAQLREGKFEQLYDESDETLHLNVEKAEFVRRMKVAVGKLKQIDPYLNFQIDHRIEEEVFGNDGIDRSLSLRGIQKLEKDGKEFIIFVYWTNKGIFPDFSDLTVFATDDLGQYATPGVSYKTISNPERY